ncbi:MAG: dihydroorotase [Culicoidibacterales bacterium]
MLLLQNAQIVDETGQLKKQDILISNGKITAIAHVIEVTSEMEVIDVASKLVAPGFIDVHVHLREPGFEYKETVKTGTLAAAKGGFTTIAPMPNVDPVPDSQEHLAHLEAIITKDACIKVVPIASITVDEQGDTLVPMEQLAKRVIGFSDDGVGIQDAGTMYQAMLAAKAVNKPIIAHTEDDSLKNRGFVHEGVYAKSKGWRGIPSICESSQIARDLMLAQASGCHYHVCHISAKESVQLIREAQAKGIQATAEVTPHHLVLIDEDVVDSQGKMNPPLRSSADRDALIGGINDGTIAMIATDHAPHSDEEKARGIELAPFGIVGLETAFPLLYTQLVKTNQTSLSNLIALMTKNPASIFNMSDRGELAVGKQADITIIDLEKKARVDSNTFVSLGKNTPFNGMELQGWPVCTIVDGHIVYQEKE